MITPRVPNWQHHSNKQPKYKKHVRIIQAAKKRTKQLIKTHLIMNIRVTLYQSKTYFVESDNEEQALAYVKANPQLLISEHETWSETEKIAEAVA